MLLGSGYIGYKGLNGLTELSQFFLKFALLPNKTLDFGAL